MTFFSYYSYNNLIFRPAKEPIRKKEKVFLPYTFHNMFFTFENSDNLCAQPKLGSFSLLFSHSSHIVSVWLQLLMKALTNVLGLFPDLTKKQRLYFCFTIFLIFLDRFQNKKVSYWVRGSFSFQIITLFFILLTYVVVFK